MGFVPDDESNGNFTPDEKGIEGIRDKMGVYSGPSLIERAPAANREAIRSAGRGEDVVEGYMRGMEHPSESETFQDQLIRETNDALPQNSGLLVRFLAGLPGSAAGKMADIFTNPVETLLTAAGDIRLGTAARAVKNVASETGDALKGLLSPKGDLMKPPVKEVENMIAQAGKEAQGMHAVIDRSQGAQVAEVKAKYTGLRNGLKQKLDIFLGKAEPLGTEETIPQLADKATTANRENYLKLSQSISESFGEAYSKALPKDAVITTEEAANILSDALGNGGLFQKPEAAMSVSEKAVMKYYENLKELASGSKDASPVLEINAQKFDRDIQQILQSRAGKKYGSGEHILSLVRESIADSPFAEKYPDLKVVRSKFKPVLQMKNEAFNIFQPFNRSGDFDTTRGINFFSRYVNGGLKPDEMRFMSRMKEMFGDDVFKALDEAKVTKENMLSQLSELDQQELGEVAGIQTAHDMSRAKTDMESENHLSLLDAMLERAQSDETRDRMVKMALLGGALGGGSVAAASTSVGRRLMTGVAHTFLNK